LGLLKELTEEGSCGANLIRQRRLLLIGGDVDLSAGSRAQLAGGGGEPNQQEGQRGPNRQEGQPEKVAQARLIHQQMGKLLEVKGLRGPQVGRVTSRPKEALPLLGQKLVRVAMWTLILLEIAELSLLGEKKWGHLPMILKAASLNPDRLPPLGTHVRLQ
jgi:hypothetical protein